MEQFLTKAIILSTSTKQSELYKTDDPRKTVYLELAPHDVERAIEFGLTKYITRDTGKPFFIVKTAREVPRFENKHSVSPVEKLDGTDQGANFNSGGDLVTVSIVKGVSHKRDFFRLNAILGNIVEIEKNNPFSPQSIDEELETKAPILDTSNEELPF